MIESHWVDDAPATRLLSVLEIHLLDFACAVSCLQALEDEYFDVEQNFAGREEYARWAALKHAEISAQLHLAVRELSLFDRDLYAALDGDSYPVRSDIQYLNALIAKPEV